MSERELAKQIIDKLPEYKMTSFLLFLRGIEFDDEIEDDLYCEKLVEVITDLRNFNVSSEIKTRLYRIPTYTSILEGCLANFLEL